MKMKIIALTALFAFFYTFMNAQTIDKTNSVVNFKIKAMGMMSIKGTYSGFSGTVNFNPSDLNSSKIDVCIQTKTVNTGNKSRDEHIRSEDFLGVEKYPTICFVSSSIAKDGEGYVATGKLTLHGVTKTIKIPLTYSNKTLKGNIDLKRLDYKVGETIGTFKAGDDVSIEIICVLK